MEGFTIQKLGKIRNKWVTDFISETLATFLFSNGLSLLAQSIAYTGLESRASMVQIPARGLMIVIATGFIPLSLLIIVSTMTKWKAASGLRRILCEVLLFVLCSGAQAFLSRGVMSSVVARAFALGVGLMVAVYSGLKLSGSAVNPNVAIMFCLLGKLPWKKLPLYILAELLGAFLGAGLTYMLHRDLIMTYEEHQIAMNETITTVHLFAAFPDAPISRITAFFDIVVGTAVLDACIAAITDPFHANPDSGLLPFIFAVMLPGILFAFSANLGCQVNSAIDFSGRVFAAMLYGTHVFEYWNYWFWIPIVAGVVGSVIGSFFYQLGFGNHLIPDNQVTKGKYSSVEGLDEAEA